MKTIYQKDNYRIIEVQDTHYLIEDLMGDMFKPECNPEINERILQKEMRDFLNEIENVGVYGYELQKWNPEIDKGWEHIDSCWGFVGQYESTSGKYNHYIVEEFKSQIKES